MPGLRLKHVERFRDRHGRIRWYYRKGHGRRIALSGEPGTFEFSQSYELASSKAAQSQIRLPTEGTMAALIQAYMASTDFLRQKPQTQIVTRHILERFSDEHGHAPVATLRREHVDIIVARKAATPAAANILLKKIRILIRFAISRNQIDHDPTLGFKFFKGGEHHTWTEEEIAAFEKRWAIGTMQRTAFALHLYTGQRRSDVCRMRWDDIKREAIRVTQLKTGAKLMIPLHPELRRILAKAPRHGEYIIGTQAGEKRSDKAYGGYMAAAIDSSGLPDRCVLHGLRKAAARRLAEAGCSANEIAAVTGHTTLQEVSRYTKAAEQEGMAKKAIGALKGGSGKRKKAK